jgi:toxin FitB
MGITYLLDTCVLSELSKKRPDLVTVAWLESVTNVAIPMGAVIEIERGIRLREFTSPERAAEIRQWFQELLRKNLLFAPTDDRVARLLGAMLSCPELKQLWVPDPKSREPRCGQDLHIAAAAIAFGYCIATYDIDDFMLIDRFYPLVGLYHPREDRWYVGQRDLKITP